MLQKNSTKVSKSRGGKIAVELIHVEKRFPGMTCPALDDVSIRIQEGEFVTVLGSSGCGKTTVLRTIAGFIKPDAGAVFFKDKNITDLPPHKREVNTIFQKNNIQGQKRRQKSELNFWRLSICGQADALNFSPDPFTGTKCVMHGLTCIK